MSTSEIRPILLVEDNLHDLELTLEAIRLHPPANPIAIARHGGEALDFVYRRGEHAQREAIHPVVVFLDLKMPKVDGLEVLRQLKSDPTTRMIPIVMLTSSREEADLVQSYQLGVNAYVVKPVGFQEFLTAIRQAGIFWAAVNEPPPA